MRSLTTICAAISLAFIAAAANTQTPTRRAAAGEGATGEIVREADEELQIDTTPCAPSRTILIFHQPYSKEGAGSVSCNGAVKQLFQAVQS